MNKKEPALGCKPYYVALAERVTELAQAIENNSANIDVEYTNISMWAKEIVKHCEIARDFDL